MACLTELSRQNTTVGAAILCPAVCVSDVIKKAGLRGKRIKYVTRQPISPSATVESEPTWPGPEELKFQVKNKTKKQLALVEHLNETGRLKNCFTFSGQLASCLVLSCFVLSCLV